MYHPTGRVLSVLEWLQSRPIIGGPELAERLETDVRTVRRYILKLQDLGIPITSIPGRFGGYKLRPGFKLPPLIFSEDEAIAVILGLIGSSWLRLSLPRDSTESALSKITRVLPKTTWERVQSLSTLSVLAHDPGGPRLAGPGGVPAETLLRLSRAVAEQTCVSLEYQSREATTRMVEPYGLGGFQGRWYLAAFCRLRKALRLFRLDRVLSFEVAEERFERPADFNMDHYVREGLENQPWTIHLRFQATKEQVREVMGDPGEVSPVGQDHYYLGPASDLDFLARTLLFCGLSFRVLEPPELKEAFARVADRGRKLAEQS